jgi:23S rRNA G2069 N7-methylase RlmK/C1962 C5-methylase RlmI/23S rRNA-/tRNA-specific pseudouridylate synthase
MSKPQSRSRHKTRSRSTHNSTHSTKSTKFTKSTKSKNKDRSTTSSSHTKYDYTAHQTNPKKTHTEFKTPIIKVDCSRLKPQGLRPRYYDPWPEDSPSLIENHQDFIIINKSYGWLTHSDQATQRPDLVSYFTQKLACSLGVHQRLDVSTSGVLAMSKSSQGAKLIQESLQRAGHKIYLAVVEGVIQQEQGELTGAVPQQANREAHTHFKVLRRGVNWSLVQLRPYTGRTHQIRAHLAAYGYPIRGDGYYGSPFDLRAPRCLLHAQQLTLANQTFTVPPPAEFTRYLTQTPDYPGIRHRLNQAGYNECYRCIHDVGDMAPGWRIDKYLEWYWVIRNQGAKKTPWIDQLLNANHLNCKGVYLVDAQIDRSKGQQMQPQLLWGEAAPQPLNIYEAGLQYQVNLGSHLSTGLFLDQRPQRAWIHSLQGQISTVLNTFAHAGGFSIAAAIAGAHTVSIDLSKQWLSRIPKQLALNGIDPTPHRCLSGDVFDWLHRLNKKGERFDLIILDPPSTSIGSKKKRWSAKKDYPKLLQLAVPLLNSGGRLLTATNHRQLLPAKFAYMVSQALPNDFELERVCPPALDFSSDEEMGIKNLIWRKK